MSLVAQVEEIMLGTMNDLAKKNETEVSKIQLMAHANGKCDLDSSEVGIKYFYCVGGKPIKFEDGSIKYLDFVKDVLRKPADLRNLKYYASDFFRKQLRRESRSRDMNIEDLDIAFVLKDEQLLIYLADNKTKKLIKKTDLKSVFGE